MLDLSGDGNGVWRCGVDGPGRGRTRSLGMGWGGRVDLRSYMTCNYGWDRRLISAAAVATCGKKRPSRVN